MKYGFYLPTRGKSAEPEALTALVQNAERLGFTSVMIADHIVFPVEIDSKYPYTLAGNFPGHGDALEQLALMTFVAAKTERLRLVSSIMVIPHRNPILTAKMLATIDLLSNGRVTVGVGVGWLKEEFEALDAPDFHKRGAVSNEYIEIFKKLWTGEPVEHAGEFYQFNKVRCQPAPVQTPHPPIWVGGHSRAALRRAARYGDGWHPVGANPAVPMTPQELAGLIDQLKQFMDEEGRDFGKMTISFKAPLYDLNKRADREERLPFTGSQDEIVEDVRTYQSLGVSELIFDFRSDSYDRDMAQMENFAAVVMAEA